ncbi:serine/threonine protein kinase [Thermocatellispora tengchongensis]|uniref:non-specific serine/threonine protein kinase n=1 Tax=Thermocatellispora tengchongensis TaxID=1073253 RepID=A0A840P4E9_9ACTN|nr:serine/threonine-protein kinase [Thermocatellispora tengchongensis]MBB5132783.1 serine/threonine protein kinase [Thermocatellispora tengchongensis]
MPEHPSRLLAGRYVLQDPLGEGGMGVVWRAHDQLLHRPVAVKQVLLRHALGPRERAAALRRTLREARLAAQLNHPGVITVHDVVEEDGLPWIVMELVKGRSLGHALQEGPLPESTVAAIGTWVLGALSAAHAAGIVHRDVKPANILLTGDRVVLTDFGLSVAEQEPGSLTTSGRLVGTPAYLAPERIRGERASAASDLWAVGVTLYQAVEGHQPFARDGLPAVLSAILTQDPPAPRRLDALKPLVKGLTRKHRAERWSADHALAFLDRLARGFTRR